MEAVTEIPGRAKRLKAATHEIHDNLDQRIMRTNLFASRALYGRFLLVQHAFHCDTDVLYTSASLAPALPDLAHRRRLTLIEQDLRDLGLPVPANIETPAFGTDIDLPTAIGWLYVAEGSNLGAAFLLKGAGKLGLSETFGARHLAAAPEGRGLSWRKFTSAVDAVALTEAEEQRAISGATEAFARVRGLVESLMPLATVK